MNWFDRYTGDGGAICVFVEQNEKEGGGKQLEPLCFREL